MVDRKGICLPSLVDLTVDHVIQHRDSVTCLKQIAETSITFSDSCQHTRKLYVYGSLQLQSWDVSG